jgi:hypothetical protein
MPPFSGRDSERHALNSSLGVDLGSDRTVVEEAKRAGDVSAFFRSQAKTSVAAATAS